MKLLFICTHNRCRSILAEAITKSFNSESLIAASAGSSPQGDVHPMTIKYLQEKGINTDELRSQSWHDFENFEPDVVLTMCDNAAKETCPVWFNPSLQVNWALDDPSKKDNDELLQKKAFYKTMDIIERRIEAIIKLQSLNLSHAQLKDHFLSIAEKIHQ